MKLKEILRKLQDETIRIDRGEQILFAKIGRFGMEKAETISQIRQELLNIRKEIEKKWRKDAFGFATTMEVLGEKIDEFCEEIKK